MNIRLITRFVGGGGRPRRLVASLAVVAIGSTLTLLAACGGPVHGFIQLGCHGNPGLFCHLGGGITFPVIATKPLTATSYYAAFTTQNVVITDGAYSGVLAVYDQNNNLLASLNVSYYVSGNMAYLSNVSAVEAWVQAHNGAVNHFEASADNIPFTVTNPNATYGQVTVTTYVDSQSVASDTSAFHLTPGGGGGCTRVICQPKTGGGG